MCERVAIQWVLVSRWTPLIPSKLQKCWIVISAMDLSMTDSSRWNDSRPSCDQGDTNTTFGEHAFVAFQWQIVGMGATIIGSKDNECVVRDGVG